MAWVVADSSLVLATVLVEPLTHLARSLWQAWETSAVDIAAPALIRYEWVSVIRKTVHQQRLTSPDATVARQVLNTYPITFMLDDSLLDRAYDLAITFQRPTAYDAQYLAVAERLQCDFWTADERLYNAVHRHLPWVKWLGNYVP